MFDGKALGQQILSAVKDYVARASSALAARLDSLEQRIKDIPSGRDGTDGKSVTIEEVAPVLTKAVADAVALIPVPKDGKDGRNAYEVAVSLGFEGSVHDWMQTLVGQKGDKGDPGEPIKGDKGDPGESIKGDRGEDGKSVILDDLRPLIEEAVKAIPVPKDGKDGSSVTLDQVMPLLKTDIERLVSEIPVPSNGRDGKDGKDGVDGKSITVDDIRAALELQHTKWVLDFERRSQEYLQKLFDAVPKPKDGRDAFDLENIDIALADDERKLTLAWVRGEERVERSVILNYPIYRGVYKHGEKYQRGDTVTFGGSTFTAIRETDSKPETDDSWKLSVKRGRDGKDGVKGDTGPKGKDAYDLREQAVNRGHAR